ncbi:MAG: hypothetical protein CMN89_08180 [Sutterellaceae bacterium]|jgi:hypothetical protein|uniref:hypothetical protein n=1 Tax=unclassified Limnobacter TaxID=2630203 RepID=UPI000C450C40|nr:MULTISPECIES: hypothetical protein [unclassified Limnobacter]MAG80871.1 hypothetical protein [Sutterellaceae bacterium]MBT84446.1 hypothetical protein [Sutterellaceae bacterium]MDZ4051619.1 hypothetical protein [Limnobacter sp.]HAV74716.1 hypothetical protein [Limnobacter sp.]|tara:strand:+ start:276 stop:542 length:267 start_codon:yes stop_codon:yes gene_type:complete
MCDPVTAGIAAVGSIAAISQMPKPPQLPEPEKIQQAQQAKRPNDQRTGPRAGTTQQGGMPSPQSTLLTGPGGVDPSMLQLGRSTLLGQ